MKFSLEALRLSFNGSFENLSSLEIFNKIVETALEILKHLSLVMFGNHTCRGVWLKIKLLVLNLRRKPVSPVTAKTYKN